MPTNVVKTPEDEKHWNQAKDAATREGQGGNYAYIMGTYMRIKHNARKGRGLNKSLFTHAELKAAAPVLPRKIPQVVEDLQPASPQELKVANNGRRWLDLYHKTASKNVPSILKEGLVPRKGKPTQGENPAYNAVYFSTDQKDCDSFHLDEPASVLHVKLPIDDELAQRLRPDEDTYNVSPAQAIANGDPIAYCGTVHPVNIHVLKGDDEVAKSFDEAKHPRDSYGKFSEVKLGRPTRDDAPHADTFKKLTGEAPSRSTKWLIHADKKVIGHAHGSPGSGYTAHLTNGKQIFHKTQRGLKELLKDPDKHARKALQKPKAVVTAPKASAKPAPAAPAPKEKKPRKATAPAEQRARELREAADSMQQVIDMFHASGRHDMGDAYSQEQAELRAKADRIHKPRLVVRK